MDYRTSKNHEALYVVRVASRPRRCDGHLNPVRHRIRAGEAYVAAALPPDSELGNQKWWHYDLCANCAPPGTLPETEG